MALLAKVPLAWLNLTHDKRRLLICTLGVAFAVFLMFVELGFWNGLLDASVELIQQFNGEIIIVSKARYALNVNEPFTRRRIEQALAVPDVESATPVYLEYAHSFWKDTANKDEEEPNTYTIRVIAFDPDRHVLNNPAVDSHLDELKRVYNVLTDAKSKEEYGDLSPGRRRELSEHYVHIVGNFTLGTDFTTNGSVIMSDLTFASIFPSSEIPDSPLSMVDVGVVRLRKGADAVQVRRELEEYLPHDVNVYTKKEFIEKEKEYWQKSTPIGFIFRLGLWMGFIVGAVICYQIISTDVADHLAEFATLKAIGYQDLYLNGIVLRETLWLAVLGYIPGVILSFLLYRLLDTWIGLPMRLTWERGGEILGMTVAMCAISGFIALRKVKSADPAEVF
jgi:putative ABC transport system permease protein